MPYDMPTAFTKALTLSPTDQPSSSPTTATTATPRRKLRLATLHDIPRLCAISHAATAKFASIPALADLASDTEEPLTVQQWLSIGNIYVLSETTPSTTSDSATSDDDTDELLVGFIAAHPLDNTLYIPELAVHPAHQNHGIGSILVRAVCRWAFERATFEGSTKARVSLATYADVPWNGPWYAKLGFAEVGAEKVGPWHVEIVEGEKERALAREGWRRCCMLWEVETGVDVQRRGSSFG